MSANLISQLTKKVLAEKPRPADCIIWLQGDQFDRAAKVLELFRAGFAPLIVLSGNNVLLGKNEKRPDENNISLEAMKKWLLDNQVPEREIMIDDRSLNTREQAEHVISLAQTRNWQTILLVSSDYNQPRAFLTFLKRKLETNWPGDIVNQAAAIAEGKAVGGRKKTAAMLFAQEQEKIKTYTNHVAPLQTGLEYLTNINI